ncbi:MAG TPA: signal recognition particle-docking protein FtsY [Anaerolineae bacterium]|jgi:fused signal recognition particle receptor|nr:signal recognition particle-docking protein FtsY [Anaerolineae bacterium]
MIRWFKRQRKEEEIDEIEVAEEEKKAEEVVEPEEIEEQIEEIIEESQEEEVSWFARLKSGLTKSRDNIVGKISGLLTLHEKIDDELWDDIEAILIQADLGIESTMRVIDNLRDRVGYERISEPEMVLELLKEELTDILRSRAPQTAHDTAMRRVYLIVGVNGTGKTTTIAKLARSFVKDGKSVLLGAADTFRAAAVEQLDIWARRLGVDIVKHERGADPAAVVYDAIHASNARRLDVLLIDTAGRLHTYVNLMEELKKIKRIAEREKGDAELETLLVIDATTGQNGIAQARLFHEALNVDGIVLTKLDGTAKGGIVLAIQDDLAIPIRYVGVGEGMDDLQEFNPEEFIEALVG